jgi:hypothetical protein
MNPFCGVTAGESSSTALVIVRSIATTPPSSGDWNDSPVAEPGSTVSTWPPLPTGRRVSDPAPVATSRSPLVVTVPRWTAPTMRESLPCA